MSKMNQRRSERFLPSKNMPAEWKGRASAGLFCSFNFSSLLPSVDLDSFNGAHFGQPPKEAESKSFVKYLSAELVEQSKAFQPRQQVPSAKDAGVVRRGAARRLPLKAAHVSLSDVYKSSPRKTTISDMIKTGQVNHLHGAKQALDRPQASTSGRAGGEFWNERRRARNASDYLPLGTLYNPGDEDVRKSWGLPRGKTLEESVRLRQNHSVSTGFQQGMHVDERSVWLSSLHKFGGNHVLATQYADDLKGGTNFNINTTHKVIRDSTLSTNLCTSSYGNCSIEVELQREKKRGNQEVLQSLMTNLRTGERLLKVQARNVLKDILFLNSIISDLRGQHALRCMATLPLGRSAFLSSSLETDLRGGQKVCLNAMQKIHGQILIGAYFITDLKREDSTSLEGKHQLYGRGNLVLKLTNYHQDPPKWDFTTSLTTKKNSWLCSYKNSPTEGRLLGCEWRHEIAPEEFFSLRAATKNSAWTLLSEMSLPC